MPNIAFIGCAHIHTTDYSSLIGQMDDFRISAVFDRDPDRAKSISDKTGAKLLLDPTELLSIKPDGIMVLSETVHHPEDVELALKVDCPIFVEKPLAINGTAAEKIANSILKANVPFHTGFFLRNIESFHRLKEKMQKGVLGHITQTHIQFTHDGASTGWLCKTPWMMNPSMAGYGVLGDLGIHCVDLLRWLLEEEVCSVDAEVEYLLSSPCDTYGRANLKFTNGTLATLELGWIDKTTTFNINISGSNGTATLDHIGNNLILRHGKSRGQFTQEETLGKVELNSAFCLTPYLELIQSQKHSEFLVTVQDALVANKSIDLLYNNVKAKQINQ